MKRILPILFLCMHILDMHAQENLLQIIPPANGIAIDDKAKVLEISMNNTYDYLAFQFSIYLPEGIKLRSGNKPFGSLPKQRFPYTETYDELEDVTITEFAHAVQFGRHEDKGYTTFAITPNDLSYIKGYSGTVLRIYVTTDTDMQPGIYPIKFRNVVFTKYENKKMVSVKAPEVSCHIIVGNPSIGHSIDMSEFTGYMPKDVGAAFNEWLAGKPEISEINLTGLDSTGTLPKAPNPNAIYYVKEGSGLYSEYSEADLPNIVAGNTCNNLSLTDGYPVSISKSFTACTASYSRTVLSAGWYTLYIPYAADIPENVEVETFESISNDGTSVIFVPSEIVPNVPCIFNTKSTEVEFTSANANVIATTEQDNTEMFVGTYTGTAPGDISGCYALRSDGSGFGIADETAYVTPFRAYMKAESNAKTLRIIHGNTSEIIDTKCTGLDIQAIQGGKVLMTTDKTQDIVISTTSGQTIFHDTLYPECPSSISLKAGVYIINNQKVLVR
ncbi:hypothetical protein [Xylanibacter muris]|uniref:IgGFc-binding protein N-terminal domain-containing protein n=1 Tax=Xylanibacter muris TaxID=2736290 RepID=A0ABX2AII7_9BACT|nr:hypothetical protein [Xylanibacter muris]NPD90843.1 hypothetical protein [Xylanibacter muris]